MTSISPSTQRAKIPVHENGWSINEREITLESFKEMLAHWALTGSPSTLLRNERDCELELENFRIATLTSKDGLIFGYASYLKFEGGPLEDALEDDDQGLFETYTDKDSRHVPLSEIQTFDVFDQYTNRGGIIYINKIEVMIPGVGLGKKLLTHILQSEESELCFLHAIPDSAGFFLNMGFETTGIKNGENNPEVVLALRKMRT